MFFPPFFIATGSPASGDAQSAYPTVEQNFREMIVSALAREMDFTDAGTNFSGHHKIPSGTTAARNAINDWVVGSFWLNTDTTPSTLQRVTNIGPVLWENVGLGAQQTVQTLTPGATVSWNMQLGDSMALFPVQNFTLNNPTNAISGRQGIMGFTQDAVGSRVITWGSAFKFPGGTKFVLSTTPLAVDVVAFVVSGPSFISCLSIYKALA